MKRKSNTTVVLRFVACSALVSVATWTLVAFVDNRQGAVAAPGAAEQRYHSELQYQYSRLPLGHVVDLFGRR